MERHFLKISRTGQNDLENLTNIVDPESGLIEVCLERNSILMLIMKWIKTMKNKLR